MTDLDQATWEDVDRRLRSLARRRAALDAEELQWLIAAQRIELHVRAGFDSLADYLVIALRYSRRTALERLRVAAALTALPTMRSALASGQLTFCAVRELVRVATPVTEEEWVNVARGRTVRDVELLVAQRAPGSRPDGAARVRDVQLHRLNLRAETLALFMRAKRALETERGVRLSQDEAIVAMSQGVLGHDRVSPPPPPEVPARALRASYQAGPVWEVASGRCAVDGCRSQQGLARRFLTTARATPQERCHAPVLCGAHRRELDRGRLRVTVAIDGDVRLDEARTPEVPVGPSSAPAPVIEQPDGLGTTAAGRRRAAPRPPTPRSPRSRVSRRGAARSDAARRAAPTAPEPSPARARGRTTTRSPGSARPAT